jgi:hypothetical protein
VGPDALAKAAHHYVRRRITAFSTDRRSQWNIVDISFSMKPAKNRRQCLRIVAKSSSMELIGFCDPVEDTAGRARESRIRRYLSCR